MRTNGSRRDGCLLTTRKMYTFTYTHAAKGTCSESSSNEPVSYDEQRLIPLFCALYFTLRIIAIPCERRAGAIDAYTSRKVTMRVHGLMPHHRPGVGPSVVSMKITVQAFVCLNSYDECFAKEVSICYCCGNVNANMSLSRHFNFRLAKKARCFYEYGSTVFKNLLFCARAGPSWAEGTTERPLIAWVSNVEHLHDHFQTCGIVRAAIGQGPPAFRVRYGEVTYVHVQD